MIYLTKEQVEELIGHCKAEVPNEACGILAGKDGQVQKIYRMTNRDKSSATFFMEPKEQLKVTKEIRDLGLEMTGIYHSHTESQAYPSAHDVEMAFYPEASYVIVSLKDENAPSIKSFKITDGKISEEEVKIG